MFWFVLLMILFTTFLEIWAFITIGSKIGALSTIGLMLLTGILGVWMARREGLQAMRLAKIQVKNNQMPDEAILDGTCILLGAVFLITPGFITDILGIPFFIPFTRAWIKMRMRNIMKKMQEKMKANGQIIIHTHRRKDDERD